MNDYKDRLIRCFAVIFPDIPTDKIPEATIDNLPEWDSVAMVTLVSLIEEEFGAQVNFLELPDVSFVSIQSHIKRHNLSDL